MRAHTLKVEAAAWHEDGSCVCDQCPGEDEHVQNEVHALLICQDHRVFELRKQFSFLFLPFFEDFSAAQPFLLQQINNQLVHDFLSQQNNRLFLFLWKNYIFKSFYSATLRHIFTCPLVRWAGGRNHLRQTANRVRGSSRRTAALQQLYKHVVGQQPL